MNSDNHGNQKKYSFSQNYANCLRKVFNLDLVKFRVLKLINDCRLCNSIEQLTIGFHNVSENVVTSCWLS